MLHIQPGQSRYTEEQCLPNGARSSPGLGLQNPNKQLLSWPSSVGQQSHSFPPPSLQVGLRVWAWGLPSPKPTSSHVPDQAVICDGLVQPRPAAHLPGGRGKVGIGRDHKEAGAAGALAWLPVPLQALASLQSPRLVVSVPHPHPQPPFPQACGSLLLSEMPVCPLPQPPTLCTHILRNI